MSTFLELCNIVAKECGNDAVTTVVGQTGNRADTVRWTAEAWMDIQRAQRHWAWMRDSFSFTTTAAQEAYTPTDAAPTGAGLTSFRLWYTNTFRCYSSVADEQFISFVPYATYRDRYQFGTQTSSRPSRFTVRPKDKAILLANIPDAVYTIRGEYQKSATALSANTDEPGMPDDFHILVAYGAMLKYAAVENAPEVEARAREGWRVTMSALMADQLPPIEFGEPLL